VFSAATGEDASVTPMMHIVTGELDDSSESDISAADSANEAGCLAAFACSFFSAAILIFFTALLNSDLLTRMTIKLNAMITNKRLTLREIFMASPV
jgi:hypothetical protein